MFGGIHQVKPSGLGLFSVGRFLIIDSVALLVIHLFTLSIHCDSVLVGCMFLGIFAFFIGYVVCWYM